VDLNLQEIYPSVKYKPSLTIVNYEDFEIIPQIGLPPIFRFMGNGFTKPTDTPWDSDITSQANHYFELFPVKDGSGFKFDVNILENPELWQKSLKLRFMHSYEVLHLVKGKLLVQIGGKTAWVDVATQTATWAKLDHVLLAGSRKQKLVGTEDCILQSFLTPYEYRGFIFNGIRIRFIQNDKFDPLIDVLGTEQNALGYKTIVRSFQRLIYLQYNFKGEMIERKESIVDRFDFLTAQDLIASVANLSFNDELFQLVDGTKVNTNYVDLMKDGEMISFEIPAHCVTQNPVVMEGKAVFPVFCAKNRTEFEMNFIELNK
jgi:hypothetical protein